MTIDSPEMKVGVLAIVGLVVVALYRLMRWVFSGPRTPDPWGAEVEEKVHDSEILPACPHCSTPHADTDWFCQECGAAVGDYNNLNPYLYIFSLGEVLRAGTFGRINPRPVVVLGYLVLPFSATIAVLGCVLIPCYLLFFLMNLFGSPLARVGPQSSASSTPPPLAPGG